MSGMGNMLMYCLLHHGQQRPAPRVERSIDVTLFQILVEIRDGRFHDSSVGVSEQRPPHLWVAGWHQIRAGRGDE